jgi:predicted nucleotidyltransferase
MVQGGRGLVKRTRSALVEFEPGHVPGLPFFSMEAELSEILGRKVDLNMPGFLSRYFRDRVLAEAENQYVAA